ncbi:MAG: RNA polymerase factor sigma-54 [Rhizobiaceae bacterium]|nr:RNA polymerase factor sigma-54 [Rhizobiaceae bacterium]
MLSAKLQMRQSQSLVMTPQLLQSIRLLQFSHLELQSFIDAEMEKNPLLEPTETPYERPGETAIGGEAGHGRDDDRGETGSKETEGDVLQTDFDLVAQGEAGVGAHDALSGFAEAIELPLSGLRSDEAAFADGFETAQGASADRSDERSSLSALSGSGGSGQQDGQSGESFIEQLAETRPSLSAHAGAEVREALNDPLERKVGDILVEHLDEAGYLRAAPADIAALLGLDADHVAAILDRLKNAVEPAGLFASDLADCLGLQLRRQGRLDPVMETVLRHLDLLARRDFAALRRLTGEDENGLMDILSEIRRLDPKPGHGFECSPADVVVPDVVVEKASDGGWRIELNPAALPRVLIHTDYVKRIATGRLDREEQAFISDCHASANWLVRSLDQRARTILKVAAEIVRRQDAFLAQGISGLRPMTLMSVAEAVGMHESTISRVTANKYMATPRGTFELKFFFTVAIASSMGGDAHSAESVKHRIKAMIDAESVGAVLSDDDIAETLSGEGVDLARRTVAKYREALGIPSSIQRRREMNARRIAC